MPSLNLGLCMKTDLLFVVEHRYAPGLLDGSVTSFELVLPRTLFSLAPESLEGRQIWVISRKGPDDILAMVGSVEGIAEIEDDFATGDLLLELDKRRTFRTASREHAPWRIFGLGNQPMGLVECGEDLQTTLHDCLRRNLSTKIAPPPSRALQRPWSLSDGLAPIAHELVRVNGFKVIDTLSAYRSLSSLSPIGAEVYNSFITAADNRRALLDAVLSLDPLSPTGFVDPPAPQLRCDTMLLPLDPDRVFARKYHYTENLLDIRLGLEKTQIAEKFHQSLVRRLARGLLVHGVQPMATRSLDLAFRLADTTHIVEVKTTRSENLVTQFLKGISQLLYYEAEMALSCPGVHKSCLILGSDTRLDSPQAFRVVANRATINILPIVASPHDESPLVDPAKALLELANNS